jgi:hypothetical protein
MDMEIGRKLIRSIIIGFRYAFKHRVLVLCYEAHADSALEMKMLITQMFSTFQLETQLGASYPEQMCSRRSEFIFLYMHDLVPKTV